MPTDFLISLKGAEGPILRTGRFSEALDEGLNLLELRPDAVVLVEQVDEGQRFDGPRRLRATLRGEDSPREEVVR